MKCPYCHGGQEYIVWFDYIPIRQRTAHVVVRAWHVLLGLLLLVVLAFGLPALLRG